MIPNYYLLYDGSCGFCNFWVQFILKRDKKNSFLFASLQSKFGQDFLEKNNLNQEIFTTFYVWDKKKNLYWSKSDAIIKISQTMGFPYRYLYFLKSIPKKNRDSFYLFIAKRRKLIFKNYCKIPNQKDLNKFIS